MATTKLSKEVKGIVSNKTGAVRKRERSRAAEDQLIAGGSSAVGALAAAMSDAKAKGGLRKLGPVPVSIAGGTVMAGVGLAMGQGVLASGMFGAGLGALNAGLYRAAYDAILAADEDDDTAEDEEEE